jgi:hypothetical protein
LDVSDSDELFRRADRAYDSTLRLLAERAIVADHTVAALHRGARRHEITLRLLQQSRKQLEKARRKSGLARWNLLG